MTALGSAIALVRRVHARGGDVDRLIRLLDGAQVDADDDACQVEVLGVYESAGQRYVQLALTGPHPRLLTIKLDEEVTVVSEAA